MARCGIIEGRYTDVHAWSAAAHKRARIWLHAFRLRLFEPVRGDTWAPHRQEERKARSACTMARQHSKLLDMNHQPWKLLSNNLLPIAGVIMIFVSGDSSTAPAWKEEGAVGAHDGPAALRAEQDLAAAHADRRPLFACAASTPVGSQLVTDSLTSSSCCRARWIVAQCLPAQPRRTL